MSAGKTRQNPTKKRRLCVINEQFLETAVSSRKKGLRVLSACQPKPGKFEEALAYFGRFMSTFHHIESYSYEMSTWMTIDEAMASIGQKAPER